LELAEWSCLDRWHRLWLVHGLVIEHCSVTLVTNQNASLWRKLTSWLQLGRVQFVWCFVFFVCEGNSVVSLQHAEYLNSYKVKGQGRGLGQHVWTDLHSATIAVNSWMVIIVRLWSKYALWGANSDSLSDRPWVIFCFWPKNYWKTHYHLWPRLKRKEKFRKD